MGGGKSRKSGGVSRKLIARIKGKSPEEIKQPGNEKTTSKRRSLFETGSGKGG